MMPKHMQDGGWGGGGGGGRLGGVCSHSYITIVMESI